MEWTTKPDALGGTWYEGYVDGYFVYARVFEEPSKFGINDGRMTALVIAPDKATVLDARVNYDCGYREFTITGAGTAMCPLRNIALSWNMCMLAFTMTTSTGRWKNANIGGTWSFEHARAACPVQTRSLLREE